MKRTKKKTPNNIYPFSNEICLVNSKSIKNTIKKIVEPRNKKRGALLPFCSIVTYPPVNLI